MSTIGEAYAIFFILGVGFGGSISVNALYCQEFLLKKHRAIVIASAQCLESTTVSFVCIYFLYITKYWQAWYIMATVLQVFIIIGMFWLPESPEFYFSKGKFDQSKEVLMHIARINGIKIDETAICFDKVGCSHKDNNTTPDEDEIKEESSFAINDISSGFSVKEKTEKAPQMKHCEGTLKELWGDKDLAVNLLLMSGIWSITSFAFYLGKFQLTHVAGDIFKNSFFSSIADTIGHPFGFVVYRNMKTRFAFALLFGMSALGSFPLLFSEAASQDYRDIVVPGCLFVMNFGIAAAFANLYMGHMDLFPIVFSTTSMGICNFIARTLTVFAPIIGEIDQPTPEIIFTTLCIVAFVLSLFVREKTNNYY